MKTRTIAFLIAVTATLLLAQPKVKTGLMILKEKNFEILKGKNIGLITNPTGVDDSLNSIIDILYNSPNVKLKALYGPEHGVRGSHGAGEKVGSYTDEYTGLPVFSLYGKTRKPTKEMLKGIDALVYDIQDIGSRSYTYISTMGLCMEAAAENGIEFILLDRPNPLGGNLVEGNLVEDGFFSFVSEFKIPYVYGLTAGELALFLNDTWLKEKDLHCNLKIVKMEGWKRNMIFKETGLPWVPTSPHIPEMDSPFYYAISGVLGELNIMSNGVGYTIPFKTFAAEWIAAKKFADAMNSLHLHGLRFRPISYKPYYSFGKGKTLHGVQVYITDFKNIHLTEVQFIAMEVLHKLYPDKDFFAMADSSRIKMFDKVAGTDKIREAFQKDYNFDSIKDLFYKDSEQFKRATRKYYLYK